MKYIRTKDGKIFEHDIFFDSDYYYSFGDEEILKQANTIEELCDRFVMKTLLTHYENTHLKDLLLEYDKFYCKEGINVYGAIWTDKGLIYIAKMNEKGELELL